MAPPKFGLMVGGEPPFATASQCVSVSVRAEKDGFDSVWMPDHLVDIDGSLADPWSTLGYISAVTRRVSLYTSVTDYQKVHPAKLAQIIATLDELSGDNAPFGVEWDEEPARRVEKLREYIEVMRRLWKSGIDSPVSYEGKHFRLEGAWLDQKTSTEPRVCIGAMGSTRMLNLIGTHGDAWLPTFLTPDLYRKKLAIIAESAREAGRDPERIERIYYTYVVVAAAADGEGIDVFIRNLKTFIATLCPFIAEAEGIRLPRMKSDTNYQRMVLTKEVLKEIEAQADLLPDSLVRKTAALGSPDEIIAYVEEVVKAGAQHVCFAVTRGRPEENLAVLKDKVLPYFRDSARR